jgi:hypothetical protein
VRRGDTLVVARLGRLARSVRDARSIGQALAARPVGRYSSIPATDSVYCSPRYSPAAIVDKGESVMLHGARASLCSMRVAALVAGVACLVTFVVARPQPAAAASVRTRIDALIRDAIARHGIKAAIVQATVNGRPVCIQRHSARFVRIQLLPCNVLHRTMRVLGLRIPNNHRCFREVELARRPRDRSQQLARTLPRQGGRRPARACPEGRSIGPARRHDLGPDHARSPESEWTPAVRLGTPAFEWSSGLLGRWPAWWRTDPSPPARPAGRAILELVGPPPGHTSRSGSLGDSYERRGTTRSSPSNAASPGTFTLAR